MRLLSHIPAVAAGLLTCLCSISVSSPGIAGELPAPQPTPDTNGSNVSAAAVAVEEALRQLKEQQQEQQASASRALELIVNHTETALYRNALTVSNQLAQFSVALSDYSSRQLLLMHSTESRTLRVTLLILLVVVLTAGALVLLAARSLRGLANRFSGHAMPYGIELAPSQPSLIETSAESAYTAAILDVEKRIAALEDRPHAAPAPASATEAGSSSVPSPSTAGGLRVSTAKFRSAPLALAIGTGEALVFLPRDQAAAPGDSRVAAALGRIGRLFQKGPSRPSVTKPFKGKLRE